MAEGQQRVTGRSRLFHFRKYAYGIGGLFTSLINMSSGGFVDIESKRRDRTRGVPECPAQYPGITADSGGNHQPRSGAKFFWEIRHRSSQCAWMRHHPAGTTEEQNSGVDRVDLEWREKDGQNC